MTVEFIPREEFSQHKDFIDARLSKIDISLEKLWQKYDGRPTWSVLVIISFLSSLCVGLVVDLLLH